MYHVMQHGYAPWLCNIVHDDFCKKIGVYITLVLPSEPINKFLVDDSNLDMLRSSLITNKYLYPVEFHFNLCKMCVDREQLMNRFLTRRPHQLFSSK